MIESCMDGIIDYRKQQQTYASERLVVHHVEIDVVSGSLVIDP